MFKNEAVEGTVYGSGNIFFSFYKIYEATEAHDLRLQHAFACH